MRKRGPRKRKLLVVLGVVFVGYLVFAYMNYVPFPFLNYATAYPNSTYLTSLDFDTVSDVVAEDNPYVSILEGLRDDIEIKIFGINGKTADEVYTYLVDRAEQEGWDTYKYDSGRGDNWSYSYHICTKGTMVMAHVVVSGGRVKELIGYDVVYASTITDQVTLLTLLNE